MNVILLSTVGALILVGAGVNMLLYLSEKSREEETTYLRLKALYVYLFSGYTGVIAALCMVLILFTAEEQQAVNVQKTYTLFENTFDYFRTKQEDLNLQLMDIINEKIELTGSELEMRRKLEEEKKYHRLTRQDRENTAQRLKEREDQVNYEISVPHGYMDSFHTEKPLHATTWAALQQEKDAHTRTQQQLTDELAVTRQERDRLKGEIGIFIQQIATLDQQVQSLNKSLTQAQSNTESALKRAEQAETVLAMVEKHQENLSLIKTATDSLLSR